MAKDILIVDDDKNICKVLKDYSTQMGCFNNIIFAHDGPTAFNKLMNQKFDVIILDINLPKKSGVDVLKELFNEKRALNSPANVIIISGSMEKENLTKILSCGTKNFLVKPFDEAAFQEKVLKVLGIAKA